MLSTKKRNILAQRITNPKVRVPRSSKFSFEGFASIKIPNVSINTSPTVVTAFAMN